MKINTLTLKNIINEELENVLNEQLKQKFIFPEFIEEAKKILNMFDVSKLIKIFKNYKPSQKRTLEALSQGEKAKILRKRKSKQTMQPQDSEFDAIPTAEVITKMVKIVRDKKDSLGQARLGEDFQGGLRLLRDRLEAGRDVELIKGHLPQFEYAAKFPLLKKQLPDITKFVENSYELIATGVKSGVAITKDQLEKALKAKPEKMLGASGASAVIMGVGALLIDKYNLSVDIDTALYLSFFMVIITHIIAINKK